jgi:cell division protein FtsZ
VGVVTRPFDFEGPRRASQAEAGIATLAEEVDTMIVVPNQRLLELDSRNVSIVDAFKIADEVLNSGVQGITDLIAVPALINLDFADVRAVMQGAGTALMGIGTAKGEDRAVRAAEIAISSPMLETSIDGAHGVLLSFQGASNIGLHEIAEAARLVQEAVSPQANVIFGCMIDDSLGDEVRLTVIAAGFDANQVRRSPNRSVFSSKSDAAVAATAPAAFAAAAVTAEEPEVSTTSRSWFDQAEPSTDSSAAVVGTDAADEADTYSPETRAIPVIQVEEPAQSEDGTFGDDLDIPDFLR